MVGGKYWSAQGWTLHAKNDIDLNYSLIITLEELFEMLGFVVFIYALIKYYLLYCLDDTATIELRFVHSSALVTV
jgi:hypothetical protein